METAEVANLGEGKLHNTTTQTNQTVKFYGCKSDEFHWTEFTGVKIDK